MILCIETSSSVCSVALFKDNSRLALRESFTAKNHATVLLGMMTELFQETKTSFAQLQAIAVSSGPGSYTGLRIGVSTAKGLCDALELPLIAVPTLQAMAEGFSAQLASDETPILICPMFDARRKEVYSWLGDLKGKEFMSVQSLILDEHSFHGYFKDFTVYFIGDGAKKASTLLSLSNKARFIPEFQPSASWLGACAYRKLRHGQFEDLAYFEPFYLKDSESHLKPVPKHE